MDGYISRSSGATFSSSGDLSSANFIAQNLCHARFENAPRDGADFSHANLTNSVFWFANPTGADFSHANLGGAAALIRHLSGSKQMLKVPSSNRILNTSVKWAAELDHVREVTLLGTADLSFWKDWLLEEDLRPSDHGGKARLMIVAADSKYMGISFRELSFSVHISTHDLGTRQDAVYLVRAFNSSRLFTFCEHVIFSTPYCHADVRISTPMPVAIHIVRNGEVVFGAQMQADDSIERRPCRHRVEGWEGPIFLPATSRRKGRKGKLFFARLRGDTKAYPFVPHSDSMTIKPLGDCDILRALTESHFVANEWVVRANATHARSKTYKRANV